MSSTSDPSSIPPAPPRLVTGPVSVPPLDVDNALAKVETLLDDATGQETGQGSGRSPIASPTKSSVWDVPFDQMTMTEAVDQIGGLIRQAIPSYVITANLNYVMLHHDQPSLREVTRDAALILADGQPIVWRSKWSSRPLPERVAGSELIDHLARRCAQQGWPIYFLGGEEGVAAACAKRLASRHRGMKIAGIESPPFRELTEAEQRQQDERIRRSGACLLLVAFGQPKGERWIHQHYRRLGVPVSIQLGASFDFVAGTARRAPRIWQRCGAEWAYRMAGDPRRLVPRYWANAKFLAGAVLREACPGGAS